MPKKKRDIFRDWRETANCREVMQRRFLADFAQYHYAWLIEIGKRWKARGEYSFDRFSLMDYYTDGKDIEAAGYISLLTYDNPKLPEQIAELHNIIGDHPWDYIENRDFIVLSNPYVANEVLPGSMRRKYDLFNLLDWVWGFYFDHSEPLTTLKGIVKIQEEQYAFDMLKMRMTKRDGIGKGVWPDDDDEMACPISNDMLKLIRIFYPKGDISGLPLDANIANDVLQFIGFDDPTEFVYTYQGYRRMERLMPEAMERNEKIFQKRFRERNLLDTMHHCLSEMKKIIPEIRFE